MMLTWSSPLEQFDSNSAASAAAGVGGGPPHGKEELKQLADVAKWREDVHNRQRFPIFSTLLFDS